MPPFDPTIIEAMLSRIGTDQDKMLAILQAIQSHFGYLPKDALEVVCKKTAITPADLWGVATFYDQFRLEPAGKHSIRVCIGTACHVKGSERVYDAFIRQLKIEPGKDTDKDFLFTVEKIACLGCCTLAPVVQVDNKVYGPVHPESVRDILDAARQGQQEESVVGKRGNTVSEGPITELRIGVGSCCIAGGSMAVKNQLEKTAARMGLTGEISIKPVGCVGMCHQTPLVEVVGANKANQDGEILYTKVTASEAKQIVKRHFKPRGAWRRFFGVAEDVLDDWVESELKPVRPRIAARDGEICTFLGGQRRIATEYCGHLNPLDVDEYARHEGWQGFKQAQTLTPEQILLQIQQSGLRGRGGAGFPTGLKLEQTRKAQSDGGIKYIICNGDEGDPGAFMDRMILESYPYRVLEGMAIAAHVVGATQGFLYIRAEYPLAVQRIRAAIEVCKEKNLLGLLNLSIVEGAGAFVCGEETALLASIEGKRGTPTLRPPYPAEFGLWGKPTLINNVETYATIPWILRHGAETYSAIGTRTSKGSKVFALTGKVKRGGLIEVPMGMTIRQIVEQIGGGVADGARLKAVQIGGPSGGCVPARLCDTPIDYESLHAIGSMMGSGGMVVLDENDCMVDIARYFLAFTQSQSCGKCTFCRIGTKRMLEMLDGLCQGSPSDLDRLEALAGQIKTGSLCGLGKTAPNPVLSTLRYFREEYEAHQQGICPAKRCRSLIRYAIGDKCIGCTLCAQRCPTKAIIPKPYQKHTIQASLCVRCGTCKNICPQQAVDVES
jgi:NADH:ubiquinone oxidoreductase subunit F (NADH-binding)/NADH:ubiquinone oxidoreductase subunit E/Pyruvate/2-oxoacid:ferredoxin oxidoreductase delta subunit